MGSTEGPIESGPSSVGELTLRQMRDFDAFTLTIAEGDPTKLRELENGNIRVYWAVAEAHVNKLAAAKEAADRAGRKHGVSSPHGRGSRTH